MYEKPCQRKAEIDDKRQVHATKVASGNTSSWFLLGQMLITESAS